MDVKENLAKIEKEIDASIKKSAHSAQPHVIAVTKYVTIERAREAYKVGIRHFGENRLDGFKEKKESLPSDIKLHFIGSLQSRKVKDIINEVDYFHALDSVKLAAEIQKRAQKLIKCFLQVNISREDSKHGFTIEQIDDALNLISRYDKIELIGIMTMAPLKATKEEISSIFEETESLRKRLQARNIERMPFTELSMGMSRDYDIAIQNGSTFVRIGTSFFK